MQLLDHAKQNFKDLDGSDRQPVAKQLRKLEASPQLGTPCENAAGIDLSAYRGAAEELKRLGRHRSQRGRR